MNVPPRNNPNAKWRSAKIRLIGITIKQKYSMLSFPDPGLIKQHSQTSMVYLAIIKATMSVIIIGPNIIIERKNSHHFILFLKVLGTFRNVSHVISENWNPSCF